MEKEKLKVVAGGFSSVCFSICAQTFPAGKALKKKRTSTIRKRPQNVLCSGESSAVFPLDSVLPRKKKQQQKEEIYIQTRLWARGRAKSLKCFRLHRVSLFIICPLSSANKASFSLSLIFYLESGDVISLSPAPVRPFSCVHVVFGRGE